MTSKQRGSYLFFFQARESISPSRLPSRHLLRVKGDVVFFLILGSPGFNKLFKEEAKNFNPKCCLYETMNAAAPIREIGVSIARTPTYARLHQTHLQEPEFFGSRVMRFSGDPSQYTTDSYVVFLQGSHRQKQYRKRTNLRAWGVRQRTLQVSQSGFSALTWCHEHNINKPTAKDFKVRKVRIIALSEAQGTHWNVIKRESRKGIVQKLS